MFSWSIKRVFTSSLSFSLSSIIVRGSIRFSLFFLLEIIDADYMAGHKEASVFPKGTTVGLLPCFGEFNAEEEIDEE